MVSLYCLGMCSRSDGVGINMQHELQLPSQKKHKSGRAKWWIIFILLCVAALAAWMYWKKNQVAEQRYSQWAKPVPVRVISAVQQDLNIELKAMGTVIPANQVNVQSQVSGILQQIYVQEGQEVKKGQLLAQIDPAPLQMTLQQAIGTLQQTEAQRSHAQSELARFELLFKQDSIAKQQVEQQQSLLKQLDAQVKANQAQVDSARLQLSYSKIYAPISGRVGFKQKDPGNLVQANEATGLLSIIQVRPIYVKFAVAQTALDQIRQQRKQQNNLVVTLWDRDDSKQLAVGQVSALDNQIDVSTGSIQIKALFPNQDDALFPNQFVNVRLNTEHIANALTLSSDAIQHGAKGSYVYIIDGENKARIRTLQLGKVAAGNTQILAGLTVKERVVLEGVDRLSEGQEVQVVQDDRKTSTQVTTASL